MPASASEPGSALLRCAKPALTSARRPGSGAGPWRRRPTRTESTFGTGWNTLRETGRMTRTSHASCASTDGAPYAALPGRAASRSPTSRWTIATCVVTAGSDSTTRRITVAATP